MVSAVQTVERALDRLLAVLARISQVSAWVTGGMLSASALVVGYDIAIRYFLDQTMGGGLEVAGYALAGASSWGLSLTLLRRSHVRIDAAYTHMPRRVRAVLDVIGLLAFIIFMALVTRYAFGVLQQSIVSHSRSVSALAVPLAYPQAFWFAGLIYFLFVADVLFARALLALLRRDFATVATIAGARSVSEEVEIEHGRLGGSI